MPERTKTKRRMNIHAQASRRGEGWNRNAMQMRTTRGRAGYSCSLRRQYAFATISDHCCAIVTRGGQIGDGRARAALGARRVGLDELRISKRNLNRRTSYYLAPSGNTKRACGFNAPPCTFQRHPGLRESLNRKLRALHRISELEHVANAYKHSGHAGKIVWQHPAQKE